LKRGEKALRFEEKGKEVPEGEKIYPQFSQLTRQVLSLVIGLKLSGVSGHSVPYLVYTFHGKDI